MAIVCIQDFDGSSQETYDKIMANVDASNPPAGHIVHTAGPTEGGWRIVDIWETEEHMRRFQAERLFPAIEAAAVEFPAEPRVAVHPAHVLMVQGEAR